MREIKFLLLPQWFCQVLLDTEPVLISQLKSLKGAGTYASLVQIWLQSLLPLDHEFVFLKLYNNYYNSFKGLNIWRLHFPRLSSTSYLLLFTSLTCTETSRQVLLFSPRFERWRNQVDLSTWHTGRQMQEPTETQGAPRYKASAEKRRSSMCDRGPVGLEWVVGKQYFESQCNGSNPCSKMLEMLLLAVNFSVEVLIQSIKVLMLEGVF